MEFLRLLSLLAVITNTLTLLPITQVTQAAAQQAPAQLAAWPAALVSASGLSQPYLVKDVTPGTASSSSFSAESETGIVQAGPYVYFPASESAGLIHLWRSDGTAAGTYALAGIESNLNNAIGGGIYPAGAVGERVLVNVTTLTPTVHTALWQTGGPESSQKLLNDITATGVYTLKDGHPYVFGSDGSIWMARETPFSLTP